MTTVWCIFRHLARAGLLCGALGLVGGTGYLVASQWNTNQAPPALDKTTTPVEDTSELPVGASCRFGFDNSDPQYPLLALSIRQIDLRALTMTIEAGLCFPEPVIHRLINSRGRPIVRVFHTPGESNEPVFEPTREFTAPKYEHVVVAVAYGGVIPGGGEPSEIISRETTLKPLLERYAPSASSVLSTRSPFVSLGKFVLPVAAAPRRYPFDWYALRGNLDLLIEDAWVRMKPIALGESANPAFETEVFVNPSVAPFEVKVSTARVMSKVREEDHDAERLNIRLVRSTATKWYIGVVAFIPLILGSLLCLVLFRRSRTKDANIGPEALAGVAAVLLAILPIRLVLVPASVTELTLVDYWLGFEMALTAVACLAVRRSL